MESKIDRMRSLALWWKTIFLRLKGLDRAAQGGNDGADRAGLLKVWRCAET